MLLMSGLLYAAHWYLFSVVAFSLPHWFEIEYIHVALWVLLPVTGWAAESWLGRYRAIVVGLVLSLATTLTLQAAFVMLQLDLTPIPVFILIVAGLVIGTLGFGSFYSIMLPFALDQMIGASAEEITAAVQWYCWEFDISLLFKDVLECVPIPNQLQYLDILPMIFLTLATLCLSAVLIMDCLYHKWLDTNNKTGNPIKLIFQVLNYARKNKCPRLRSALTYIDEEHPSRLDFGKHKFGGPRTIIKCVSNLTYCTNSITAFVLIPVYRLMVLPLVSKYVPTLLKMIGTGLSLCLVSTMINTVMIMTGYFSHNTEYIQVSLYWMLVIEFLNGIGLIVTMVYGIEFCVAQTPNRMRGIMMGLVITMIGWSINGSKILKRIVGIFKISTQNYTLYSSLVLPPLAIMMMIIFVIVAKRYKLRERERHVNIQAIVEEHYDRYFDQEEEYMREAAEMYKN